MSRTLQNLLKLPTLFTAGALITLLLFYLMQYLIQIEFDGTRPTPGQRIANITMPEMELVVNRREPLPPEPVEPIPPPSIDFPFDNAIGTAPHFPIDRPPVTLNENDRSFAGMINANAVPLVQVAPVYPQRAQQRGIEGHVVVEFDVDEQGLVFNARILYAEPEGYFESAALRALERYRYQPRVENGEAVKMFGLQQKLTFSLE